MNLDKIVADLDRHNNPSAYASPCVEVRDTPRVAFWRALNVRLASFGRPPANFGEACAAYDTALEFGARAIIRDRREH